MSPNKYQDITDSQKELQFTQCSNGPIRIEIVTH